MTQRRKTPNKKPKRPPRAAAPETGSLLTDDDLYLLGEGTHRTLYDKLGAHVGERDGEQGTFFAVWAPDAARVSVIGSFNGWRSGSMRKAKSSAPPRCPGRLCP